MDKFSGKVICPVDFSQTAYNAAEYAAHLAKALGADLLLLNVRKLIPIGMNRDIPDMVHNEAGEYYDMASGELNEKASEVRDRFGIPTEYEVNETTGFLEEVVAAAGNGNAIVVMGTNGNDNLYRFLFATNTYQVIKNTKCPVIVVPPGAVYSRPGKIVVAWEDNPAFTVPLRPLNNMMKTFGSQLEFPNVIGSKNTAMSDKGKQNAFREFCKEILFKTYKPEHVTFRQVFSNDIPEAILEQVRTNFADMICLTHYERGWVNDLFRGSVTRQVSGISPCPLLILHG